MTAVSATSTIAPPAVPTPTALASSRYYDLLLAVGVGVFQVAGSIGASSGQPDRAGLDLVAFVLLLVGPAALAVRRRRPAPAVVVTVGATLAYLARGHPYGPIFASLAIALFTAVSCGYRRAAWLAAAAGLVLYSTVVPLAGSEPAPSLAHVAGIAAWLLVVLGAAEAVTATRERRSEATRARQEEQRRRSSEQRLRVAQDLHDVLAHDISMINVQAGVALHLIEDQPEQARTALAAIKEASKDALGELRSVLAFLRDDGDGHRPEGPRLDDLDALVSRARAAGIDVGLRLEGEPRRLAPEVDWAAYRVVQEALTNVIRHAGAASALVVLVYGAEALEIEVADDGDGTGDHGVGTGRGIAGMTERLAVLGGTLDAGPRAEGGFAVRARIPLGDGS